LYCQFYNYNVGYAFEEKIKSKILIVAFFTENWIRIYSEMSKKFGVGFITIAPMVTKLELFLICTVLLPLCTQSQHDTT
jgi:hypothetical protein